MNFFMNHIFIDILLNMIVLEIIVFLFAQMIQSSLSLKSVILLNWKWIISIYSSWIYSKCKCLNSKLFMKLKVSFIMFLWKISRWSISSILFMEKKAKDMLSREIIWKYWNHCFLTKSRATSLWNSYSLSLRIIIEISLFNILLIHLKNNARKSHLFLSKFPELNSMLWK